MGRDKLSAAVTERKPSRAQGEFICPAAEIEEGASGRNILGAISHVTSEKERGVVRRRLSPLESPGRWKPTGCDKQAAAGGGGAAKSMVATADEKTKRSFFCLTALEVSLGEEERRSSPLPLPFVRLIEGLGGGKTMPSVIPFPSSQKRLIKN